MRTDTSTEHFTFRASTVKTKSWNSTQSSDGEKASSLLVFPGKNITAFLSNVHISAESWHFYRLPATCRHGHHEIRRAVEVAGISRAEPLEETGEKEGVIEEHGVDGEAIEDFEAHEEMIEAPELQEEVVGVRAHADQHTHPDRERTAPRET